MATNPYFNFKSTSTEQNLMEDLTIEAIKTMGMDVLYLPREYVKKDRLFGEDVLSQFDKTYEIEMYLQSVDGFEGEGDILAKYGLEIKDKVEMVVSRRRFMDEVGNLETISRPREGDLIYFPLGNYLFEINFVEHENPFYQLGKNQTYLLQAELFTYSLEKFDTGVCGPDEMTNTKEYATEFTVSTAVTEGSGFYLGETVFQAAGITGATLGQATSTGTIVGWSLDTSTLTVSSISKTPFVVGATQSIQGEKSGTEYYLTGSTLTNLVVPENVVTDTPDGDADTFGVEKQGVLDFSETDPFSEGNY
jgi:hypothetical protein